MGNVKKFVAKRTRHQRQYDRRVNKRQMQTKESKIDTGIGVDDDLVITKRSGTKSEAQDDSNRSGNDTNADNADTRPIYDEEPMAEVQLTIECNIFAIGQQHTEQPEIINEGQHGQILNERSNKAKIKKEIDVLETMNIELEHSVAKLPQIQEKVFAIAALKNDLWKLQGNSVDTKFAKTSVLGKPVLQSPRNQSVVRQPNAFKSERPQMSKQRFASQVDVNNNLSRPITQHYLHKRRESVFAKPDHMIASGESRNSSKNMPRFSSNDMVHNHYPDKARKKTQERDRNSKTSVMPSARFQSTADDSKLKPRNTNHSTRMNSRAKIQSHKTRNSNKPVDQKSHTQKPGRQIFTGHRFSPNKTSVVYEKTSPRSDLRWKPTGRIFKSVGLRWIPTGKLFDSCISKVDSETPHGSNVDIPNIHECKQTLDVSAGTSINVQKEQSLDLSAVVSNSSVVTTADAPDKRQQQPDSTSSTSTLATTVTADENFDL
ncbi:hypothetical protein Tco_0790346 [Tanacetum coccineum]